MVGDEDRQWEGGDSAGGAEAAGFGVLLVPMDLPMTCMWAGREAEASG